MEQTEIATKKHIDFFKRSLNILPGHYASQDPNRLTLAYFGLSGLDLLGALDQIDKNNFIQWVYSHQILPDKDNPERLIENCGFRGSSFFGRKYNPSEFPENAHAYDQSHIAMTYVALAMLLILGDDLSRIDKKSILNGLKHLQQEDGSFSTVAKSGETDMRSVYCACAISYMLNDWSSIDMDKLYRFILASQSYDGGLAQAPAQESHGGSTYCAVASLYLMGRLNDFPEKDALIKWCVFRQAGRGFCGRVNKDEDTCYGFWVGASLKLLGVYQLIDFKNFQAFVLDCESASGGFSKTADCYPDVLHTYFSLCGLSFGEVYNNLQEIHCGLGITLRAAKRLQELK